MKYYIDFDGVILTKVHSLTNEGSAKVDWIRRNGLKQSIILVPYDVKKTDMAMVSGNILIDDCLRNLDDWVNSGGYPILFDINDKKINRLEIVPEKHYIVDEIVKANKIMTDRMTEGLTKEDIKHFRYCLDVIEKNILQINKECNN